jgi:glycosyltransferase involved in cell wall biosynthesis
MRPLTIAFVSSHARNGGSERYLETLLGLLDPTWPKQAVSLERGPLADRLVAAGVPTVVLETGPSAREILAASWRLRRVLRRLRPDVVHANGVKAALVSVLAAAGTRLPVVWVKHDFSWDRALANGIAARCRLVVGVSEAVTASLRNRSRVRVVPTGIPELDPAGPKAELDLPEGADVVAVFGYIHPRKGQADFVEAAALILERRPGTRFLVVGGESPEVLDYNAAVRARVDALGLAAAVTFLGHREDAVDLMRACDVVVVPSVAPGEGFGLVTLEAFSVRTPVVGYAVGALPEVAGDCALLVAPGDYSGLADAVLRVLEDGELRARLVECGRARVSDQYGLERWVEGLVACYKDAA